MRRLPGVLDNGLDGPSEIVFVSLSRRKGTHVQIIQAPAVYVPDLGEIGKGDDAPAGNLPSFGILFQLAQAIGVVVIVPRPPCIHCGNLPGVHSRCLVVFLLAAPLPGLRCIHPSSLLSSAVLYGTDAYAVRRPRQVYFSDEAA